LFCRPAPLLLQIPDYGCGTAAAGISPTCTFPATAVIRAVIPWAGAAMRRDAKYALPLHRRYRSGAARTGVF